MSQDHEIEMGGDEDHEGGGLQTALIAIAPVVDLAGQTLGVVRSMS
jgi:hypothetical protein